jgi:tRNA A37 threonylcarbamoyladenosine biosynthesis protein TsaE
VLLTRVCGVDKRRGHGFEKKLSEQLLTYVGGAAGTGKTLMVMAFLRGLDILGRLDEVLTAPTGSAAAHIGGSTIQDAINSFSLSPA